MVGVVVKGLRLDLLLYCEYYETVDLELETTGNEPSWSRYLFRVIVVFLTSGIAACK